MMRHLLLLGCLLLPATAWAQPSTTPTSRLAWDQEAPSRAEAEAYTYRQRPDGSPDGQPVSPVTCTGVASPFVCSAAFPAFTPGPHALTLTAGNAAGDSLPSTPFAFTFVVLPATPRNLRIDTAASR